MPLIQPSVLRLKHIAPIGRTLCEPLMPITKTNILLGLTIIVCQVFFFATTIVTSRFGLLIMFKLVATLWKIWEMLKYSTILTNVVSQYELMDIGVIKYPFVTPL